METQEYFNSAYSLFETLQKYDRNVLPAHSMVDDFAKWLIGEESDTYNEVKDDRVSLCNQIMADISSQDDDQIGQVVAWLQGYLTAKNIQF